MEGGSGVVCRTRAPVGGGTLRGGGGDVFSGGLGLRACMGGDVRVAVGSGLVGMVGADLESGVGGDLCGGRGALLSASGEPLVGLGGGLRLWNRLRLTFVSFRGPLSPSHSA